MCFAFRARARWKCGLPSLESSPRTWSMLLEHWKPSAEEAVRPLPRTRKGLQAALNIWPPCPSWRRRTGNQATHAQKKFSLGMWMIFGLDFLTPKSRVKNGISPEQACLFLLRFPLSPLHWFCHCLSWYVHVLLNTFSFKDDRQSSRGSKTGETKQKIGILNMICMFLWVGIF